MKLFEINQPQPVFAWLEPAKGPENIQGIRLAFLEPLVPKHEEMIANAKEQKNEKRAQRLKDNLEQYKAKGQMFFTPDFGWWMTEDDFHTSKEGFGGITKGRVMAQTPNLVIVSSREQAIKSAKEAGII